MNELTLEWIKKAEGDFVTATELLNLSLEPTADAICFHCQQCAEKYAKAYLHHQSIKFPWTHSLSQLLALCEEQDGTFSTILMQMLVLNNYSVEARYPGRFTSLEEAESAVQALGTVRDFIRSKLGL